MKRTITSCNQCEGTEPSPDRRDSWIAVDAGLWPLDFCSWACIAAYAKHNADALADKTEAEAAFLRTIAR